MSKCLPEENTMRDTRIKTKMTLVWQHGLSPGCPKGKIAAQCSHAAVALILQLMDDVKQDDYPNYKVKQLEMGCDSPLYQWLNGSFTKTVVRVNSEDELIEVYNKAREAGLNTVLITDNGETVFNQPTKTVVRDWT